LIRWLSFLFATLIISGTLKAQEAVFPRFASLRSDTVYMRSGPGERFPIEWVYKRKGFPVIITDSFEHWHKVQDVENTQGWIHKTMLSGKRTALTPQNEKTILYKKKNLNSKHLAYFNGQSIIQLLECFPHDIFCKVKYNELKGYILKEKLFGLFKNEEIDE